MKNIVPASGEVDTDSLKQSLLERYLRIRSETLALAAPVTAEDAQIQSMPDVSPTKWHLGHTSWFFETFLLRRDPSYAPINQEYKFLFNSYYNAVGEQYPRPRRGLVSRPALDEVLDYRHHVDQGLRRLLENSTAETFLSAAPIVRLGLHHEQQHQELLLTDILHVFWTNPLRPAYREGAFPRNEAGPPIEWLSHPEGIYWIGHEGDRFSFDNERPRHRQFVHAFEIASRPVSAGEYMEFLADGGYERPELWLSDGWTMLGEQGVRAPLYWERRQGTWWHMTLYGMRPVDPHAPLAHVSYYEADAYARWRNARLPTEAEWEVAVSGLPIEGNLQDSDTLAPKSPAWTKDTKTPMQMYGDVWEWTASAYLPYPGYRVSPGALGEYNGKFMCNQMVLRGGSCATPADHIRPTYRNFFPPSARWQFTGVRLARDPER